MEAAPLTAEALVAWHHVHWKDGEGWLEKHKTFCLRLWQCIYSKQCKKGANSYGQLGLGHRKDVFLPQVLKGFLCNPEKIKSITGGGGHSAVLTDNGKLFLCGQNKDGQLGLGHTEDVTQFTLCTSLCGCPVMQVACGWDFTIVLAGDGQVFSCGSNSFGQLGHSLTSGGGTVPERIAIKADLDAGIITETRREASSDSVDYVKLDQFEFVSTDEVDKLLGSVRKTTCPLDPCPSWLTAQGGDASLQDKVITVAAGLRHALAVTENGSVFQWGIGMASQAKRVCQGKMVPSFLRAREPCKVTGLEDTRVKSVTSGSSHASALTDEGELYVWGSNKHRQLVSKDDFLLKPQKIEAHYFEGEKVSRVWNGWTHMMAQTETGKVFTWGRGDYGQLGRSELPHGQLDQDGKRSDEHSLKQPLHSPAIVPALTGASQIACGSEHNLAIVGGQCFSWGWNEHGMCGSGTEVNVCLPQPLEVLSSAKSLLIGCGAGHSMAFCHLTDLKLLQ